jgi:O-6-methylguanine DNA methyltransferase
MAGKGPAYPPTASTARIRVGTTMLRVVWTNAGVAYVADDAEATQPALQQRLKMRLMPRPLPPLIREALHAAHRGDREIGIPVDLSWAPDYMREVLFAAMRIPRGQTRPYSWLAREARRPLAVRAAASAMARNPLWLLVPCHRVIAKDGTIGSYGPSGVERKRRLLAREGIAL